MRRLLNRIRSIFCKHEIVRILPNTFCPLRYYETPNNQYVYYGYSKCVCVNCGKVTMFERFRSFSKPQKTLYDQDS